MSDTKTLFEYVILYHEGDDDHTESRVVSGPELVLASSQSKALLVAARSIDESLDIDNTEVVIRPF